MYNTGIAWVGHIMLRVHKFAQITGKVFGLIRQISGPNCVEPIDNYSFGGMFHNIYQSVDPVIRDCGNPTGGRLFQR
jgi:hypothetical protein